MGDPKTFIGYKQRNRQTDKPNLYIDVEDMVVFLDLKVFNFDSYYMLSYIRNAHSNFYRETSIENYKHWFLIHTWSDKTFKGTIVNRALSSVQGGQFKIRTVPVKMKRECLKRKKLF